MNDCASSGYNDENRSQQSRLYRQNDNGLVTIFNADDPSSYFNWRLGLGNSQDHRPKNSVLTQPRFREMIDSEVQLPTFELTGEHDGSVYMICPPHSDMDLHEELPYLNFIMTDLGGYASIEVVVTDEDGRIRTIQAKNFISRTCISEPKMEIPMRLRPSWNYACLDLNRLMKDAWNKMYQNLRMIKINANFRIRRIYFSDKMCPYDDLPKEFQMNMNLAPKTQVDIIDFEKAFPPLVKDLYQNIEPSCLGKPSLSLLGFNRVKDGSKSPMTKKDTSLSQKDIELGLKLSIPSNHEVLSVMMSKSVQYKPDGVPSILWKYPQREGKTYQKSLSRPNKGELITETDISSRVGFKDVADGIAVNDNNADSPHNSQLNESEAFCDYIWKPTEVGQSGEWEMIENFNVKPQAIAKMQKYRRGEGLYDIYNARMVSKDDKEFFGFGDNEEELKLIMKRQSGQNKKHTDSLGSKIDQETFRNNRTSAKLSDVDKNSDWDFLKHVESGTGPHELGLSNEDPNVSDHRSIGTDPSSTGSDEDWLLTWTYEGLDWKETRMKNQGKLNEEIRSYLFGDKRHNTHNHKKQEKCMKTPTTSIPSWKSAAVPSKPMQCDVGFKGTGMFYHACFDSKTLPFQK